MNPEAEASPRGVTGWSPASVRLVLTVSLAVAFLSALPILSAARLASPNAFLGITINARDQWVYLSFVEQARQGGIGLVNLLDSAPSRPLFFNLMFSVLGWMAGATGLTSVQGYILGRLLLIPLLAVVLWRLVGDFVDDIKVRRYAFLWMFLGTGVGWISVLHHWNTGLSRQAYLDLHRPWLPADLWIPESNCFSACLNYPTMVGGILLLCLSMSFHFRGLERPTLGGTVAAGMSGCLLGFVHIYPAIVFLAVLTVTTYLWQRSHPDSRRLRLVACTLALAGLPFAYYVVTFSIEPWLRSWSVSLQASPSPTVYVMGLGLAAPLALWRVLTVVDQSPTRRFLVIWILVQAALLYSGPILSFERRLIEGLQVPVVILATEALVAFVRSERAALAKVGLVALVAVTSFPTTAYLVWSQLRLDPTDMAMFRPRAEVAAFESMSKWVDQDGVVLCSPETGLLLPAFTGRRVAVGQEIHTPDFPQRSLQIARFYRGEGPLEERLGLLRRLGVTHVYWGTIEGAQGGVPSDMVPFLELLTQSGPCKTFKVRPLPPAGSDAHSALPPRLEHGHRPTS